MRFSRGHEVFVYQQSTQIFAGANQMACYLDGPLHVQKPFVFIQAPLFYG